MFKLTRQSVVVLVAVWASSATAGPITDIVTVDGKEWAQADLFTNLSWDSINTVCPSGLCTSGGTLNGYTMNGWIWASTDEFNGMINSYLNAAGVPPSQQLGPGVDLYSEIASSWAPEFFSEWRQTDANPNGADALWGRVSNPGTCCGRSRTTAVFDWGDNTLNLDVVYGDITTFPDDDGAPNIGGWFYRENISEVPTPATFPLLGLALAALGYSRRKRVMS